jgi:Leucine-rich repeat (LRR) protein
MEMDAKFNVGVRTDLVLNCDLKLKHLKHLSITGYNKLYNLEHINPNNLPELRQIHISDCILEEFPNFIFAFKNLETLILTNCRLREISENITQFTNLRYLDLRHNQIEEIPTVMSVMKNLKQISLRANNIKTLPDFLTEGQHGFLKII